MPAYVSLTRGTRPDTSAISGRRQDRQVDGSYVGRLVRAVRVDRGLTQGQVARMTGVSQRTVARAEGGDLHAISLDALERVAVGLGIRLRLDARWQGGDGDRLMDREHAAVVEAVVAELRRLGWEVVLEYTFNHYGERGSVDVIGWHALSGSLVIIEVKSRLLDLQDLLASLGRKIRIVPDRLADERGWEVVRVGRVVALPGTTANRGVIERHRATFDASFPSRASTLRRFLRDPGDKGIGAVWFVSSSRVVATKRPRRVRPARSNAPRG